MEAAHERSQCTICSLFLWLSYVPPRGRKPHRVQARSVQQPKYTPIPSMCEWRRCLVHHLGVSHTLAHASGLTRLGRMAVSLAGTMSLSSRWQHQGRGSVNLWN